MMLRLRVMTFNLRFENDFDGENHWNNRRDLLVRTILKYRPHVVGTQEGKPSQLRFLSENLDGYRISATSRHWDEYCQYPTLYYLDEFFSLAEDGEFWLSKTPEIHLSKDWDSAFPRMMSFALLQVRNTSLRLWFSVTHLDHVSQRARIEGARMLGHWAANREGPTILAGDFNDFPGSEVHRILTGARGLFADSWETLGKREDERSYTHHAFTGIPCKGRIDWILADPDIRVLDAGIVFDHEGDRYPSDHFPYWVDLELA
ncbi:MAG: endonuclease/exonuclease/phosphatase family protein [Syntrophobacteria bacterium]